MPRNVRLNRRALALAATSLLGCAAAPAARPPATRPAAAQGSGALAERIAERVAAERGASVAVAFVDLARADSLFIGADSPYHAASTMKVPVMIQLYRDVDSGRLALDRKLLLVNRFASIVDGSPYALDSAADSDTSLYRRLGDSVTVGELIRGMITRSSNLATNTLIAVAEARRVTATMRSLGATRMQVLRGVEDQKAFDRGLNNTTTARDLAVVLAALEQGRAASPASTRAMREILLAQEFNEKIPAGLPPGTPVAHKTGEITAISHDAAVVYPRGRAPYVLVVLTRGINDGTASSKLIADISRYVYQRTTANAQAPAFTLRQVLSAPFPTELVASPATGAVAWVFDAEGARNVWVAAPPDYVGRAVTSYTGDDGQDIGPLAWLPDGSGLLFVRGSAPNDKGEIPNPALDPAGRRRVMMLVKLDGGSPREIAEGAAPQPSPDGRTVVYVKDRQLWSASLADPARAAPLFRARGTIGSARWSPDGSRLAFVSSRGDHSFVGIYDVRARRITYADPSVDLDQSPVWSPDGRSVAFIRERARLPGPVEAVRRSGESWSIRIADAATGAGRELWRASPGAGSVLRELDGPEQLFWGMGERIVFPWEAGGWLRLYSVSATSSDTPQVAATLLTPGSFEVEQAALTPDRRSIVYSSNQNDSERRHLWSVKLGGGTPVALTRGAGIEWSPTPTLRGVLALLRSDAIGPARPAILVGGVMRDLAPSAIPATFPRAALVTPVPVEFPATDGLAIRGQLFLPAPSAGGAQRGRRPAVVFFHGGSQRQMVLGWNRMSYYSNAYAFNQYLASQGYVVLSVNYRGGIGYGLDFREAPGIGALGATEFCDVLGAARYLRGRTDVDSTRIGVWGGSWGGFLTALALARASDRFAAGVDFAGVHDWNLEWERWIPGGWDASREQAGRELALRSSPLADVSRWTSPVLLIQGDDDRNVVFSQTVQLAEALRRRSVPVELLVFPDETHDFLRHESWVKSYEAAAAFFGRWLGADRPRASANPSRDRR